MNSLASFSRKNDFGKEVKERIVAALTKINGTPPEVPELKYRILGLRG